MHRSSLYLQVDAEKQIYYCNIFGKIHLSWFKTLGRDLLTKEILVKFSLFVYSVVDVPIDQLSHNQ